MFGIFRSKLYTSKRDHLHLLKENGLISMPSRRGTATGSIVERTEYLYYIPNVRLERAAKLASKLVNINNDR